MKRWATRSKTFQHKMQLNFTSPLTGGSEDKLGDVGSNLLFLCPMNVARVSPLCVGGAVRGRGGMEKPCGQSGLQFGVPALEFTLCTS